MTGVQTCALPIYSKFSGFLVNILGLAIVFMGIFSYHFRSHLQQVPYTLLTLSNIVFFSFHTPFSYSFIKLSHFLLKRKPTEAIIFILSPPRYCSLVTFREVFYVNKVHIKPENLSAKSCESMPSLQLVLSADRKSTRLNSSH